jgi:hypothetical protein
MLRRAVEELGGEVRLIKMIINENGIRIKSYSTFVG